MEVEMLLDRLRQTYRQLASGHISVDIDELHDLMKDLKCSRDSQMVQDTEVQESIANMLTGIQIIMKEFDILNDMIGNLLEQTSVRVREATEDYYISCETPGNRVQARQGLTSDRRAHSYLDARTRNSPHLPSPPLSTASRPSVPVKLSLSTPQVIRSRPGLASHLSTPEVRTLQHRRLEKEGSTVDGLHPWHGNYHSLGLSGLSPTSPLDALAYAASIHSGDGDRVSLLSTPSRSPSEDSVVATPVSLVDSSPNAVLRAWFLDNLLAPYPTLEQKKILSFETGLKMRQIDDWFINARRRSGWTKLVRDGCGLQAKGAATAKNMSKAKALGRIHISKNVHQLIADRLVRKEDKSGEAAMARRSTNPSTREPFKGQLLFPESHTKMRLDFIMDSQRRRSKELSSSISLPATPDLDQRSESDYDYFVDRSPSMQYETRDDFGLGSNDQVIPLSREQKVLLSPIKFRNKGGHNLRK